MVANNKNNHMDKSSLEKEWANNEARLRLTKEDRIRYDELRCTLRPYVYFNKIMVVWSVQKGEPEVKEVFTATSLDASFQGGVWVKFLGKVSGQETVITHTPQRLAPGLDVFAWVPFFNELRYTSQDGSNLSLARNLRLSVCFKMADDPRDNVLRSGLLYISELNAFRERFPQYSAVRL